MQRDHSDNEVMMTWWKMTSVAMIMIYINEGDTYTCVSDCITDAVRISINKHGHVVRYDI